MKPTLSKLITLQIALVSTAMILIPNVARAANSIEAPTIVVAPLRGDSAAALFNNASCSEELAHIFNTELGRLTTFRVLENLALQDLKDEMKLGEDGWVATGEITEIGHFKGADFIFLVRVTRFGSKEKEYSGPGVIPIPPVAIFRPIRNVMIKRTEHEVQLDWRVIDASSRVAVKTGRGIGIEKGTTSRRCAARASCARRNFWRAAWAKPR